MCVLDSNSTDQRAPFVWNVIFDWSMNGHTPVNTCHSFALKQPGSVAAYKAHFGHIHNVLAMQVSIKVRIVNPFIPNAKALDLFIRLLQACCSCSML